MRSPIVGVGALAAAVLLSVVGCTSAPGDMPTSEPTAVTTTASPTPTPTPSPSPTPVAAVLPFDGDCRAMLTDEDVSELLGESLALNESDLLDPSFFDEVLAAAGGMHCGWYSGTSSTRLTVSVLPLALVAEERRASAAPMVCEEDLDGPVCVAELAVGNTWLIVGGVEEQDVAAGLAQVGARVVGEQPTPATMPADAWAVPPCDAFAGAVQEVTGAVAEPGYPSDDFPRGPLWDAMVSDQRVAWCGFQNLGPESTAIRLYVVPGAAAQAAADSAQTPVEVAGADAAWHGEIYRMPALIVTVGSNVLTVNGPVSSAPEQYVAIAEAVLRELHPRPAEENDQP